MASLTKKLIGGKPYYYLRECRRVNGKPKIVWQEYIGTPQQLVLRLTRPDPQEAVIREFGALVAAFHMAQQLDIAATIDRHIPKRGTQGPSVGQYLLALPSTAASPLEVRPKSVTGMRKPSSRV